MQSAKTEIIERKLKPLFWDYVVDPAEAYDVLMGRRLQAGPFNRERLLIRLLERLPWYDLLEILGPEGVKSALTQEIIHKLRFPDMKERYEFIRRTLHAEPVSFTGWNPENRARVGAALELDTALPSTYFRRLPLPWEAAFFAGKCFLDYRRKGGLKRSPLPDFYIQALMPSSAA